MLNLPAFVLLAAFLTVPFIGLALEQAGRACVRAYISKKGGK